MLEEGEVLTPQGKRSAPVPAPDPAPDGSRSPLEAARLECIRIVGAAVDCIQDCMDDEYVLREFGTPEAVAAQEDHWRPLSERVRAARDEDRATADESPPSPKPQRGRSSS